MKKNILQLCVIILTPIIFNYELAAAKQPDYWPTKGWRTAPPESQGMDSSILAKMMDTIWEKNIRVNSVLVIRNGYMMMEAYSYPFDEKYKSNIYSCSKSVTAALVGVAVNRGYITDVHRPVLDFFPKRVAKNLDADKEAITFENLLTMTTGLECRDSFLYSWRGLMDMRRSGDWVQFMIDLPMAEGPGTYFEYCNGATFLLSAILQKQTGMTALSFAEKHLFAPLGILDFRWPANPRGITLGYDELYLRPRDMAKIGLLYLNDGLWDGQQIISSQWIKASTRSHIATHLDLTPGYGYQWWTVGPGIYTAIGYQGHYIVVLPEKNLLTVFTGSLGRDDIYIPLGLLAAYIIPAVKSTTALPENPHGEKALQSKINLWQVTSPAGREKLKNRTKKSAQRLKPGKYVNSEHGFTVNYDAELIVLDNRLKSPWVFKRRGLRGLPAFTVLVDDIPPGMALEFTADYMIDLYKITLPETYHRIKEEKLIKLSNGTNANYVEINWNHQSRGMLRTVGVFAYKNNKIIGAVAGSMEETPVKFLADMVKSLKFAK